MQNTCPSVPLPLRPRRLDLCVCVQNTLRQPRVTVQECLKELVQGWVRMARFWSPENVPHFVSSIWAANWSSTGLAQQVGDIFWFPFWSLFSGLHFWSSIVCFSKLFESQHMCVYIVADKKIRSSSPRCWLHFSLCGRILNCIPYQIHNLNFGL